VPPLMINGVMHPRQARQSRSAGFLARFPASHVLPSLVLGSKSLANSLQLLERVKGIEPSSSAWKAVALPLSYTRAGNSRQTSLTRSSVFPKPTSASPGMVGEVVITLLRRCNGLRQGAGVSGPLIRNRYF
jgi:hypothetical protein